MVHNVAVPHCFVYDIDQGRVLTLPSMFVPRADPGVALTTILSQDSYPEWRARQGDDDDDPRHFDSAEGSVGPGGCALS